MCRITIEKRHKFDDVKSSPPKHGHIVYPYPETDETEPGEEELKSSPFENRTQGHELVTILLERKIISEETAYRLGLDIANSELP